MFETTAMYARYLLTTLSALAKWPAVRAGEVVPGANVARRRPLRRRTPGVRRPLRLIVALVATLTLAAGGRPAAADEVGPAKAGYTITEIGVLPGGTYSGANAINRLGQVI